MAVIIEPKWLIIGNFDSKEFKIIQRASWIPFLHKFLGFNLEVTRQLVESFDGKIAQIGNITLHLSKDLIAKATGFPHMGKHGLKNNTLMKKHGPCISINPEKLIIGSMGLQEVGLNHHGMS